MNAKRERPIRKMLSFSEQEWADVERRITLADARSFEQFGRTAILRARSWCAVNRCLTVASWELS